MSYHTTFGYNSLVGNCGCSSTTSPAAPNLSVQYNNTNQFAGDGRFIYDPVTAILDVPSISPDTIRDQTNSTGVSGQYLTSTGTALDWADLPAYPTPAAPFDSVQYNDSGDFGGDSAFTYDSTTNTLAVTNIKPTTITDDVNSVGTSGQYLTSTGTGVDWVTPPTLPVPGGVSTNIQFNNAGAFDGSANFVRNLSTGDVNINANLGVGSLTAPTDRLVVTGPNAVLKVKSTVPNSGVLVLEDGTPTDVKQCFMSVSIDTADFTSIQQNVGFKNFRFNPFGAPTSCVAVGTTGAQALGGFMCSNHLSNRKIILNSQANDEHQNYSLGVNTGTFRFQLPSTVNTRYSWFAGTSSSSSNELMRLTSTGNLGVGTTDTNATGIQLSNALANRKLVFFQAANNDHQYYGFGLNANTLRFQIPDGLQATRFQWLAGAGTNASNELMRLDGFGDLTVQGNINMVSTKYVEFGDGSRQNSAPIYFYDSNATFNGTTGHRIYVRAVKKFELVTVDVSIQREGGIHFDLNTPGGTISSINIAVLPATWRPLVAISTIGIAANNNNWATNAFCWGSFHCSTAGEIRMQSPNTLATPILTVQPNLENISGTFVYFLAAGQTLYNADGITR